MLEMSKYRLKELNNFSLRISPPQKADIPPDVASNLRRIRHDRGHSLETLAKLSGVSRAMLGQIETGKSVPTITLIWKVAKALGVPATTLISNPVDVKTSTISEIAVRTVSTSAGLYQVRLYSSPDFAQPFELGEVRIAPGHREHLPALTYGARATLLLTAGAIEIVVSDVPPARLTDGGCILYQADVEHSLFNPGTIDATAYLIVAPARNRTL